MTTTPIPTPRRRWLSVLSLAVCFSMLLVVGVPSPASAADGWGTRHGAGWNSPGYTDQVVFSTYRCVISSSGYGMFKVENAKTVMWTNGGQRIKGFKFKYRLVPAGSEGQILWPYNWSDWTSTSFKNGTDQTFKMTAPKLGQSFDPYQDWDLQVRLKYPRSLRRGYTYTYRRGFAEPQDCGIDAFG